MVSFNDRLNERRSALAGSNTNASSSVLESVQSKRPIGEILYIVSNTTGWWLHGVHTGCLMPCTVYTPLRHSLRQRRPQSVALHAWLPQNSLLSCTELIARLLHRPTVAVDTGRRQRALCQRQYAAFDVDCRTDLQLTARAGRQAPYKYAFRIRRLFIGL